MTGASPETFILAGWLVSGCCKPEKESRTEVAAGLSGIPSSLVMELRKSREFGVLNTLPTFSDGG